jgi:hypothetical protein
MESISQLGWLIVITPGSKVSQMRLSAAMDLETFARLEYSHSD